MTLQIDFAKVIEFDYTAYQDDVLVVGKKNEGKTERIKRIIETKLQNKPYWIFDTAYKFSAYGHVVHKIQDLQYGQYVFQFDNPNTDTKKTYGEFLNRAFYGAQSGEFTNLIVITDELQNYTTKQEVFQPLYHLVTSGRNFGLSSIFATIRPQSVPNYILDVLTHVFAYQVNLKGTIGWLEEYIGIEAWLLLSPDKRLKSKKAELREHAELQLTPHSLIYRDQRKPKPQVILK